MSKLNCHLNDGQSVTFTTITTPAPGLLGAIGLKETNLNLTSAPSNSGCSGKIGKTDHTEVFTEGRWGRTYQLFLGVDENGKIECRNPNSKPEVKESSGGVYTITCKRQ